MAKSNVGSTNRGVKLSGRQRSETSGSGSAKPRASKLSGGGGGIDNFEDASKPPSNVTLANGNDLNLRSLKSEVFNNPNIPDNEVFAAFGALSGSKVKVEKNSSSDFDVLITAPYLSGTQKIRLSKDKYGKVNLYNANFRISDDQQNKGFGTKSFARQVEFSSKLGVDSIKTYSASSKVYNQDGSLNTKMSYNNHYIWARLGYDSSPPTAMAKAKSYYGRTDIKSIADLFDIKASGGKISGANWWKENGSGTTMTFDLTPGSRSRKRLAEYSKSYFSREGKNIKLL